MSAQQLANGQSDTVEMKLEVVVVPVSDVDRAKEFYAKLGWRVDADFANGGDWRLVQVTPHGSACSFFIGNGITNAAPGSAPGLIVVVDDVDAARNKVKAAGGSVSDVFHFEGDLIHFKGARGRVPGRDPQDRSYFSIATFTDPDGNTWAIQEIKTRFPGRGISSIDVATLGPLLREAEETHTQYEASAPKHHWSAWYAPFLVARARGLASDEAAKQASAAVQAGR